MFLIPVDVYINTVWRAKCGVTMLQMTSVTRELLQAPPPARIARCQPPVRAAEKSPSAAAACRRARAAPSALSSEVHQSCDSFLSGCFVYHARTLTLFCNRLARGRALVHDGQVNDKQQRHEALYCTQSPDALYLCPSKVPSACGIPRCPFDTTGGGGTGRPPRYLSKGQ